MRAEVMLGRIVLLVSQALGTWEIFPLVQGCGGREEAKEQIFSIRRGRTLSGEQSRLWREILQWDLNKCPSSAQAM